MPTPNWNYFPKDKPFEISQQERREMEDLRCKFIESIERQMYDQMKQDIRKIPLQTERRIEKPRYNQTPLKAPSQICLHFVGGPRNCEQQFHPFALANVWLQQGRFTTLMEEKFDPDDLSNSHIQAADYKLVPIPQEETPWAEDMLIVIAVYIESPT